MGDSRKAAYEAEQEEREQQEKIKEEQKDGFIVGLHSPSSKCYYSHYNSAGFLNTTASIDNAKVFKEMPEASTFSEGIKMKHFINAFVFHRNSAEFS